MRQIRVLCPNQYFMLNPTSENRISSGQSNGLLKTLVDRLLNAVLPDSVKNSTLILNEVDRQVDSPVSERFLLLVLGNLLHEMVQNTRDGCIHIKASTDGETISVSAKPGGFQFDPLFHQCIDTIETISQYLGGHVHIGIERGPSFVLRMGFGQVGQRVA